ncbi:hypothetical protein A3A68_01520 [Candidatus Saccharibacteria bacterium RIFCSPLOWO2_01_FULL_48_13]|nr:MAG: hypothetical protein A3A68_01520 [Candidatus Saccharibacteria bacterium RIFCSPLOWO2_01_FULL_48_13]
METEQGTQPTVSSAQHLPAKKKSTGKKIMKWLLMLLVIAAAAAAGWYYRDMQAKDDAKVYKAEIAALKAANTELKKDVTAAEVATKTPSADDLANIKAAVESGNYAALEQMMTDPVTVILAASEGLGERTPTQAVADLAYLDGGTDPWDFALSAATLDGYGAGGYKQYFPKTALVGKSANNYVVSFSFDNNAKIKTIFMANNDDLL